MALITKLEFALYALFALFVLLFLHPPEPLLDNISPAAATTLTGTYSKHFPRASPSHISKADMSGPNIPAGGTWFDTHKRSFVDVPIDPKDKGISTSEFLEAAEATATLFDLLGSVAFTPVKNDMIGNIKKIRDRQLASPGTSATLQSLVRSELSSKPSTHTATEGLLWLVRGLDFTAQALRHDVGASADPAGPELSASFRTAYKATLAPHHSFLIKPVFSAAMGATPYRKDFYGKMVGQGAQTTALNEARDTWLKALEERVAILKAFQTTKEAKW